MVGLATGMTVLMIDLVQPVSDFMSCFGLEMSPLVSCMWGAAGLLMCMPGGLYVCKDGLAPAPINQHIVYWNQQKIIHN
jgi:hypothetical protein